MMKLSFVFLCLSLATLSLASISSAKKKGSLSSSKQVKTDGGASSAAGQSSQAAKKKLVRNRKRAFKKRQKKRVGTAKGLEEASAGAGKEGSVAQGNFSKFALNFPKVLVELIGAYLDGSYSVVFERNWSAAYNEDDIAVDSERHYLITHRDVQASSHGDGEPMSLGSPGSFCHSNFQSSHDGRSVFFTCRSQEQISSNPFDNTTRCLVQETGTKGLKSVTLEGGEISCVSNEFMLSANGKTLLSTSLKTYPYTASVYQIKGHGRAGLAFKKGDFDGFAHAVSRNGNRILMKCNKKEQFEIHDISRDKSDLVLKVNYTGTTNIGSCALNNDGSKAAFIVSDRALYIVDVNKQKDSISVDRRTAIKIPSSVLVYSLIYDAKDRLYAFGKGNLWLVDLSERKLVSLEEAQVPKGYEIVNSAVSPNGDYIALLIRSEDKNEKEEYQYQIIVKRNTKDMLMHLCGYKS